ncbi:MAG TPA: hypothetical protein VG963_07035 [Polyangiaceae bacterium]|nr:hypothetical protein [Polyangiaceae bacterium]
MKTLTCTLAGARPALELCDFDGKHFRFVSDEAFAPGQPLALTVALAAPLSLQLKSLGSTRRADGRYDVRARAATLRRDERTALLAFFQR